MSKWTKHQKRKMVLLREKKVKWADVAKQLNRKVDTCQAKYYAMKRSGEVGDIILQDALELPLIEQQDEVVNSLADGIWHEPADMQKEVTTTEKQEEPLNTFSNGYLAGTVVSTLLFIVLVAMGILSFTN